MVPELFRRVLGSLARVEEINGIETEFIVINDGSRDGTDYSAKWTAAGNRYVQLKSFFIWIFEVPNTILRSGIF